MLPAEMVGEPRRWPLARPDLEGFALEGTRAVPCLLLHGFTASPTEMRPLGESLAAAGFPVRAVRFPGHGTSVEELATLDPAALIDAAESALQELAALPGVRGVAIAGQSMGGLIALILAARHPKQVVAVASLAAPLWFHDRRARLLVPLFRWTPFLGRVVRFVPRGPSAIPEERRAEHFTYDRFPTRGVVGLSGMMKEAWRRLPQVTAPLLVGHGALDATAPPLSADRIVARAGSASKEKVAFEGSRHVLTMDVEAEKVCARVVEFFTRHAGQ